MEKFDMMKIKCHCGGNTEKITSSWKGIKVRAWRCKKCKEEIIHPVDSQKAFEIAKARDNMELLVKVRKIGKSITLTIPHVIAEIFKVKPKEKVEWEVPAVYGKGKLEIGLR